MIRAWSCSRITCTPSSRSAVIYGLSAALIEQFSVKDGALSGCSNFDSYPVMRMSDVPEIHTKIVATDKSTDRMGEIGVVSARAAIANACSSSRANGFGTFR